METATTSYTTDVLIVGAGPVGMTLALTLRRAGVAVTIVDREPKTGQFTRAAIVWPRTLEVFDLLGIVGDWEAEGVPVQRIPPEYRRRRGGGAAGGHRQPASVSAGHRAG